MNYSLGNIKTASTGNIKTDSFESSFTWTISKFSTLSNPALPQKNVIVHNNENIEWYVDLHPYNKDNTGISIYLFVIANDKVKVDYKNLCEDKNGKHLAFDEFSYTFEKNCNSGFGWEDFIKRQDFLPLKDDTLIIKVWVSFKLCTENVVYTRSDLYEHISNNFNELYKSGDLSDVTIETSDGCQFPAHKCILGAHSPVFKAMFEHDMKENQENKVKIVDLDSDIVKDMLEFIYSYDFKKNEKNVCNLFIAADKYDISLLKIMCEIELLQSLNIENAIDYLILADDYQAQKLKSQTLQFIKHNLNDIKNKNILKNLDSKPSLLREILEKFP